MRNRGTKEERLTEIKNRLSRRQFARFTALSAIAATMSTRARGVVPIRDLEAGCHCMNFLTLLDHGKPEEELCTIQELVFDPFVNLLNRLHAATIRENYGHLAAPLDQLRDYVQNTYEDRLTLRDLYTHSASDGSPDHVGGTADEWNILHNDDHLNHPTLVRDLSMPFRVLPPRADDPARENIEFLLSEGFRLSVGDIRYQLVFTRSRDYLFNGLSDSVDRARYQLVRHAFEQGVFRWTPDVVSTCHGQFTMASAPNDRCAKFDAGAWVCESGHQGKYCKIDSDGYPTSASDICQ